MLLCLLSWQSIEKYCDDTLQYSVKIALSTPPLQYPEVDVKTRTSPISARTSSLHVKADSSPLVRKRSGSTLGDLLPRKRQKVSTIPPVKFSKSKQSPRHPSVFMSVVLRRASIAIWRIGDDISIFLPHLCSPSFRESCLHDSLFFTLICRYICVAVYFA